MWRANIRGLDLNLAIFSTILAFTQISIGLSAIFYGMPDILRILHAGFASLLWFSYVSLWASTSDFDPKIRLINFPKDNEKNSLRE